MKRHKSFDAYFKAQNYNITNKIKLLMMDVWTNARYGYIDTQPENKNFDEWLRNSRYVGFYGKQKNAMLDAWDAAVESYPEDRTKTEIKELRAVISKAMQMKCSCKENEGCTCDTYKARATAIFNFQKYLGKL